MRTKIKSYGDEPKDFNDKEISKADSNCICLAVITIDSAFKKDENYYPHTFLKQCKYIEKEVVSHVIGYPEISFDESDEE